MTLSRPQVGRACGPILVALFWGSAFVSIKFALRDFSPALLVTLRYGLASLGFLALYAGRVIAYRRVEPRDWPRLALLVASGVVVYHLSLAEAETVLSATTARLIGQTTAVFALGFSAFGDPAVLRARTLAGIALATAGAVLVISGGAPTAGGHVPLAPALVCFLAPMSLAAYTVLGKSMVARYGAANLSAQVCLCGTVALAAWAGFRPWVAAEIAAASTASWCAVACLALLSTVAGYTLWYVALARRSAAELAMYTYLIPVFGVLLSALLPGESITAPVLGGGLVVVAGIALTNGLPARVPRPVPAET